MRKNILKIALTLVFLINASLLFAQGIKGKVTDSADGSTMPGVTISVNGTTKSTATSVTGEYNLKLDAGSYTIKVSSLGYETLLKNVTVDANIQTVDFILTITGTSLMEVAVIGSRSKPRSNIESLVPVDVISAKEIRSFPQTDVTQILNYIAPSFSSNRQTVADGTDHIDPASLRGLGPDQVLVLVNGKRRHNTALVNINGTFGRGSVGTDMNSIPVAAIERIEVLRDGAAAQYGSDAIAGVINIVLKKVTPLTISSMYGQSASNALGRKHTDGKNYQFDASKGWDLSGKGFVNLAAQYLQRDATNRGGLDTRPLLFSSPPVRGTNETEADFQTRFAGLKATDDARAVTNGVSRNNMIVGNSLSKNFGSFLNTEYSLSENAKAYLSTGYTRKTGEAAGFTRLPFQTTQIDVTIYPTGFLPFINTTVNDISIIGGVKGKALGWNYDLSNTYGQNNLGFDIDRTINASYPAGTSPTSFYAGKLKFGQNTTNFDVNKRFDFQNKLSSLNMAYGAEFRSDNYQIEAGEEGSYGNFGRRLGTTPTASGSQVFPGFNPKNALNKSRNNVGLYADYELEFGKLATLGVAGRFENFSDFGSNFSYKVAGKVKVASQLIVRGAIATGFRAPSLAQRYLSNESTQFVAGLPTQVLTVNNDSPIVGLFGVGSLKAEKSTSYSSGITGTIVSGLTYTIDAYLIDIKDRIVFSSQFTRGIAGVPEILNTVDPTAQINSIQFFTNAIGTRTKGLDVVLTDRIKLNDNSTLTLSAAANFNQTRVRSIQGSDVIQNSPTLRARLFDRTERSRFESSVPASKINLSTAYATKKLDVSLRTVYFGRVAYLNPVDPATLTGVTAGAFGLDQEFAGKWITDLSVGYKVIKQLTLTLGVNNLFDVYPDRNNFDPRNNETNFSSPATSNYTTARDNTSNGRFAYSRAVSQFGFNGRFVSSKLTYVF